MTKKKLNKNECNTSYEDLLRKIKVEGIEKADRTGTGTRSIFGHQMRFDLAAGFPLITTKKVYFKAVIYELLWFLLGRSDNAWLKERGVSIWDEWADKSDARGDLGPIYGVQWRSWPGKDGQAIDQLAQAVQMLKTDPDSRRIVVSAWNVAEIPLMRLAPCHVLFQFYVGAINATSGRRRLSCQMYQRSADVFLGVPFNIASYALLTHMVADQCGFDVGDFIWTGGDCHLYNNHLEQTLVQMEREPFPFPQLKIQRRAADLFSYEYTDFVFENYQHHPALSGTVSV